MQEADNKHNCDRQKPKSDILETHQFLQLHVVLVDCLHVKFLWSDRLINIVQFVNHFIDQMMIFLLRKKGNIAQLKLLIRVLKGHWSNWWWTLGGNQGFRDKKHTDLWLQRRSRFSLHCCWGRRCSSELFHPWISV